MIDWLLSRRWLKKDIAALLECRQNTITHACRRRAAYADYPVYEPDSPAALRKHDCFMSARLRYYQRKQAQVEEQAA
jgi:hypothetical protein